MSHISPAAASVKSLRRRQIALAAGLCVGVGGGAAAAQPPEYRAVAVSGQQAPGSPAGVVMEFLSSPRVNNAGMIAFWARLGGPGASDPKVGSIWTASPDGALSRVVQGGAGGVLGDQTPFDPEFRFIAPIDPALDAKGGVTFLSSFSDVPSPTHFTPAPGGLFAASGGGGGGGGELADLASREGTPSPYPVEVPDPTFTSVLTASTGAPGTVTFVGGIGLSATAGHGIFTATEATGPIAVAARSQQAPGLAQGLLFSFIDAPAQGAPGSLLFRATLQDNGTVVGQDQSLWTDRGGALQLLAQHGDPAPGTPAGTTFADFGTHPVLVGGNIVFAAKVAGAEIDAHVDTGLWTDRDGPLAALVREGDAAPGTGGAEFASISPRPAVNGAADVAFAATLRGDGVTAADNSGIWIYPAAAPGRIVVREGDQVRGMPGGVRYAVIQEPVLNSRGQMAFLARLRGDKGSGVSPASNFALLASDRCGNVTPVARTGDLFAFTPPGGSPAQRTIADIVFEGGSPRSGRAALSDGGVLVFTLRFTDGSSGLFAATVYLRSDVNRDGQVNSGDITSFLTLWLASIQDGTLAGDFNEDGMVNSADITAFLTAWLADVGGGC